MTPIPEILKTIQERADRATAGPWRFLRRNEEVPGVAYIQSGPDPMKDEVAVLYSAKTDETPAFIAAARSDVPRLVKALQVLIARVEISRDAYIEQGRKEYAEWSNADLEAVTRILNEPAE